MGVFLLNTVFYRREVPVIWVLENKYGDGDYGEF
jgi:hypothetical protein